MIMMVKASLVAVSLYLNVSVQPDVVLPFTQEQKTRAVTPSINEARLCIAQRVAARNDSYPLDEAITEAAAPCAQILRAMVDTIDDVYGEGSGEKYLDTFIDTLPAIVQSYLDQMKNIRAH